MSRSWPPSRIDEIPAVPVLLVRGAEEHFAAEAIRAVTRRGRREAENVEISQIEANQYQARQLDQLLSPSLFAEPALIIIRGFETTNDALLSDALRLLPALWREPADARVVLQHRKGARGKKLLDALAALGVPTIQCDPLRNDRERAEYLTGVVRSEGRRIASDALGALIDAVGEDLAELSAAARQLITDTTGVIDLASVRTYYAGRVEASGFEVADQAIAGAGPQAVVTLRQAVASGTDVVPVVAALAMKLRTMAKVAAIRQGGRDAGLASWQIKRAEAQLKGWTPDGLATAMVAVAAADVGVKGGSRDAMYAVESALLTVASARHG